MLSDKKMTRVVQLISALWMAGLLHESVHRFMAATGFPQGMPQAASGRQGRRAVNQLPDAASYSRWRPRALNGTSVEKARFRLVADIRPLPSDCLSLPNAGTWT